MNPAATQDAGAKAHRLLYLGVERLHQVKARQRADVRSATRGITYDETVDLCGQQLGELGEHRRVHEQALRRDTALVRN